MKKQIWMIEQQSRVKGEKEWSTTMPMYAYKSKEKAELDTNYLRGYEDDGYLEYNHIITEYDLYDE